MASGRHSFVAFYPSDWLAGTARMARMHRSVYFDICCYIWDTNEPCPKTELPLMFGDIEGWDRYVDDLVLSGKLTRNRNGSLSNAKAHAEAKKAFDLWEKKSNGGRTGAEKTNQNKAKGDSPDGSPGDSPDGSSPKMAGTPDAEPEPEPELDIDGVVAPASARAREETVWDTIRLAAELCRIAGVRNLDPGQISANITTVTEWVEAGADPPLIIPVIEQGRDGARNGISRLKYFDRSIHKAIAKRDHPSGKSARTDLSQIRDPLLREYLENGGALAT